MKKHFTLQEVYDKKLGFSTLIIIVISGAVALTVILALALVSISSSRITKDFYFSQRAKSLANACAMQGLILCRNDKNYFGSGNLNIDEFTCNYLVIDLGGLDREIRAWSEVSGVVKKVRVLTKIAYPQMSIDLWQEVSDF
ncbi:MAG TPA: hypothetical protein PKL13_02700 [bacterium]|nr:hypothetical protein [bacterium]